MGDDLNFTVGAREIYEKLLDLGRDVREMKEDRHEDLDRAADIEQRIRRLERLKYEIHGAAIVGSAALGWILQAVMR